jgi:integrase
MPSDGQQHLIRHRESPVASVDNPGSLPNYRRPLFMRNLGIDGWQSSSKPVDNLLRRLARRTKSEATLRNYTWHLHGLCQMAEKSPSELVHLKRNVAERLAQRYADSLSKSSPRYANTAIDSLSAFFSSNGYKHFRALELERYSVPRRSRSRKEHIPTKEEVYRMADCAGSLRNRAIILTLFSSGFRNSTLRALLYGDVMQELEDSVSLVRLPCYLEMKKWIPYACKGGIPYYSFICTEARQSLALYLKDRLRRYGELKPTYPLFATEHNQIAKEERNRKSLSPGELQIVVKSTASKAGIEDWNLVHPHCLRKSYETVLHSQLIDGSNMDVKVQEVFMGHVLPRSQDNYFDMSKVEQMRMLYSKLKFGRTVIENKYDVMKMAVARAFEGTDLDPEAVILDYAREQLAERPG